MLTTKWHGNAEILTMVTSKNAEPLGLSNLRNPYHWKLGAPKKVHSPDLLLVDGNPIDDITLVVNSDKNFILSIKDRKIYKNSLVAVKNFKSSLVVDESALRRPSQMAPSFTLRGYGGTNR
jgi:hypothetical protein